MTFIDKHGQLGIWDARAQPDEITDEDGQVVSGDLEGGKYWRLQVHWPATSKSSISCIKFDPANSNKVRFQQHVFPHIFLTISKGVHKLIRLYYSMPLVRDRSFSPNLLQRRDPDIEH